MSYVFNRLQRVCFSLPTICVLLPLVVLPLVAAAARSGGLVRMISRVDRLETYVVNDQAKSYSVIKIEGPSRCKIEVEVFETQPTVTFDKLANNKLADSIAGPVIDSESDCEINGLRGFSVTRRNDLQENKQYLEAGVAAVIAPERHTVLHDGRRQVYVISFWPEDSEELQRAVDTVVESIEVT